MAADSIGLGRNVEFETSNGGSVLMVGNADHLHEFGVSSAGWAYYDNLYLNPYSAVTLDVSGRKTAGTLRHITGDVVFSFNLASRVPNGRVDVEVKGLAPFEWYRLDFGTVLAKTDGGRAHGQASMNGELIFPGVHIPNA